jgi:Zn-finger nucleic acid-binding protein
MNMTCPRCDSPLREQERSGVTVDFCTNCRGVWLDAGELHKLIEREQNYYEERYERRDRRRDRGDRDDDRDDDDNGGGFLGNLMDLFGN